MKMKKFEKIMNGMPVSGTLAKAFRECAIDEFRHSGKVTPQVLNEVFIAGYHTGKDDVEAALHHETHHTKRVLEEIANTCESILSLPMTESIDRVEAHDRTLVVFWKDGDVTSVRASKGDSFDPRVGLCVACMKHSLGGTGNAMKKAIDSVPGMAEALATKDKKAKPGKAATERPASPRAKAKTSDLK